MPRTRPTCHGGHRGSGEVVFTLRRRPGMSDEGFRADAAAVAAGLTRLKQVLEGR
jgi:hypothetical protein